MKSIFKFLIAVLIIFISYQTGYRNGYKNRPSTVKTIKESVTTTVVNGFKVIKEVI